MVNLIVNHTAIPLQHALTQSIKHALHGRCDTQHKKNTTARY